MAKEKENKSPQDPQASKLEAIKEIIFGQEKQDLDRQLDTLRQEVEAEHNAIRQEIAQLNDKLQEQLAKLEADLSHRLDHHQSEIARLDHEKAARQNLGKLLIAMGEQIMAD